MSFYYLQDQFRARLGIEGLFEWFEDRFFWPGRRPCYAARASFGAKPKTTRRAAGLCQPLPSRVVSRRKDDQPHHLSQSTIISFPFPDSRALSLSFHNSRPVWKRHCSHTISANLCDQRRSVGHCCPPPLLDWPQPACAVRILAARFPHPGSSRPDATELTITQGVQTTHPIKPHPRYPSIRTNKVHQP